MTLNPSTTKKWWESKGIIGGLVALLGLAAAALKLDVSQLELEQIAALVTTAIGIVVGIWGRKAADKRID